LRPGPRDNGKPLTVRRYVARMVVLQVAEPRAEANDKGGACNRPVILYARAAPPSKGRSVVRWAAFVACSRS